MGRRLQKANDLYDEYYEFYFAFEGALDQVRSGIRLDLNYEFKISIQILIKPSSCMFFDFDKLLTWEPTDCVWGCIFLEGIIIILPQYALRLTYH